MKNSLPPTNEVELTASSPQEAQTQEYKSTLLEQCRVPIWEDKSLP